MSIFYNCEEAICFWIFIKNVNPLLHEVWQEFYCSLHMRWWILTGYLQLKALSKWIIRIYLEEFIVCEQAQVNPNNSWAMSALIFLNWNWIYCTKKHFIETTIQNAKTLQLAWMKNVKFTILPFKTDIPLAVAFLVFLGIPSSLRELISASDKLSNFESAKAMV